MSADADRFRELYQSQLGALLGYAARRVSRAEDAADVVAEVFAVVWRRIDDVPDGEAARPWMFGIARNVLMNFRRGEQRRDRLIDRLRGELGALAVPTVSPIDEIMTVRRALARLSGDDRELLLLTNWDGLTPSEVAIAMGIPAGTIRSRLHRARQHLRSQLRDDDDSLAERLDAERSTPTGHVRSSEQSLAADYEELR